MNDQISSWRRKEIIGMVFGFYTLFTMFFIPRLFAAQNNEQLHTEFKLILFFGLGNYIWAILTFTVFYLGERFPVQRPQVIKNLLLHFFLSLLIAAIFSTIYVVTINSLMAGNLSVSNISFTFIINTITNSFMYYTGSLAVHQAIFYSHKYREREFRLQQAELEMLKMQLHPHFFFNTLNAISALIYRSPKDADRMITQLGDLFRVALKKDKAQEITLQEELEFLESYLQIHQVLMGKRLKVTQTIEEDTLDAFVPNLILQPLVENAVKHGIAPLEEGGRIEISAAHSDGFLFLQVRDDGLGLSPENGINGQGIGLVSTQARLRSLYGDSQQFEINNTKTGGVSVKIKLPFKKTIEENV